MVSFVDLQDRPPSVFNGLQGENISFKMPTKTILNLNKIYKSKLCYHKQIGVCLDDI